MAQTAATTRSAKRRSKPAPATKKVLMALEPRAFKETVSRLVDEKPPYRKGRWKDLLEIREVQA